MIFAMYREGAGTETEVRAAERIGSIFDELAAGAAQRMIDIRRRR